MDIFNIHYVTKVLGHLEELLGQENPCHEAPGVNFFVLTLTPEEVWNAAFAESAEKKRSLGQSSVEFSNCSLL